MALLQHVAMQFEPGPLVRAGPGRHGGGAGEARGGAGTCRSVQCFRPVRMSGGSGKETQST